jgi:hypothetical protein
VNNKADLQTSLDEVTNAVAEFSKVQAGLSELREKYEKVIFPVDTTDGMKDAREARQAIRGPRYEVERIRKEAKAPILSLGRQLDSKAKEITDALLAIEEPIDLSIKHEEGRKERERQAKIEAEQKRVEAIQSRIASINEEVSRVTGRPSAYIREKLAAMRKESPGEDEFQEFHQSAVNAHLAAILKIEDVLKSQESSEAEQERIKVERAELEKLRAEMAEREAKDRADREAAEAEAKAKREIEEKKARDAREEEDRKQRAALEAERKRQAEEQARIDAENKKLADERAELERQKAAERRKAEEAERKRKSEEAAELQRREEAAAKARKAKYPGERAIVEALCEHFGVTAEVVQAWLSKLREAA